MSGSSKSDPPPDLLTPWITRITTVGAALAAVVGAVFPSLGDTGKSIAYGAAAFLVAVTAGVYIWRRQALRGSRHSSESAVPSGALLRGLLPFEEGDALIGRDGDLRQVLAIIRGTEFRFGVIWGQSGCGKTSFLRARLMPALRAGNGNPVYLERPTADPAKLVEAKLAQVVPAPDAGTPRKVVIIDQFEEFFLLQASKRSLQSVKRNFATLLERDSVKVLVSIREDYFARLQSLAPDIPDPTSPRTTYELENLRTEQARDFLQQSVVDGESEFEPALINRIVTDLDHSGYVRPPELQLVATHLWRRGVHTRNQYDAQGGAVGIISSFIREEINRLQKPIIAQLVLRRLCSPAGDTKAPEDVSIDDFRSELASKGLSSEGDQEILTTCLSQFLQARVIVETEKSKYNLVHDFFAPLIRSATEGVESTEEQANRLLQRYLAEYREDRYSFIPRRHLSLIRRNASRTLQDGPATASLLRRSYRKALIPVVVPAAVIIVPLAIAYGVLADAWYLSTQPSRYSGGIPEIVVRSGQPYLRFLPGFNYVVEATGLTMDDLGPDQAARDALPRGEIWGFGGEPAYSRAMAELLTPMAQATLYRLTGEPERSGAPLLTSIHDWKNSPNSGAAFRLGLIGRANAKDLSARRLALVRDGAFGAGPPFDIERLLYLIALDEFVLSGLTTIPPDPARSSQAVGLLDRFLISPPEFPPPRSENPSFLVNTLVAAFGGLALVAPTPVKDDGIAAVFAALHGEKRDPWAMQSAFGLATASAASDDAVAQTVLHNSLEFLVSNYSWLTKDAGWESNGALLAALRMARERPAAVTEASLAPLLPALNQDPLAPELVKRTALALSKFARANPRAIPPTYPVRLKSIFEKSDTDPLVRAVAAIALTRLGVADRTWRVDAAISRTFEVLTETTTSQRDPFEPMAGLKPEALIAIGDLALVEPLTASQKSVALAGTAAMLQSVSSARTFHDVAPEALATIVRLAGGVTDVGTISEGFIRSASAPGTTDVSIDAADILLTWAKYAPKEVLNRADEIRNISVREGFGGEQNMAHRMRLNAALARATYVEYKSREPDHVTAFLIGSLAARTDAETQMAGAYGLLLLALDEPAQIGSLKEMLIPRLQSRIMTERMAVTRTLEMLRFAEIVAQAKQNEKLRPWTRAVLDKERNHPEDHISFAALMGLEALDPSR